VIGCNDPVVLPRESVKSDWEVELGVVIGSTARYVTEEQRCGTWPAIAW
jgi:2,4-diketo-3-deoxy-L-fuconate hydrolase